MLPIENLQITVISGLVHPVDAVLHSLDDAVLPAANWVLGDIEKLSA